MIRIICSVQEECDEKYAGGLWDLAAELERAGSQEAIYNILRSMIVQGEGEGQEMRQLCME